jgi:hypothetical protein
MKTQALSYHPFRLKPQQAEKRHGTQITANTVNHVSSVFAEPQPSPTSPPEPIKHSSIPAHAFWTANAVVNPSTGTALEYPQLKLGKESKLWLEAASREIGRLAQGKQLDMPTGSNTMHFINHCSLLAGCRATYLRIAAAIKLHKAKTNQIRFTVGGNRINYKGRVSTPTTNLETIKILRHLIFLPWHAHGLLQIHAHPRERHSSQHHGAVQPPPLLHNGDVLTEIRKGMYGLPQAGTLAYNRLAVKHLALSNYTPAVKHTPGLFRHATRPVAFSLVVDNFAIKYVDRVHAEPLLSTLRSLYNITTEDWTGQCIVESHQID